MAEAVRHDKTARQLRLLSDALDSGRLGPVRRLVNTLSPAEIGNLLESLPPAKRTVVWGRVDPEDDGEVLVHVGDEVREGLLAADRNNDALGELYSPLHPAVLRLLSAVVRTARERGKPVSVCGEMAGDAAFVPLLLALGLEELSMHPGTLLEVRRAIRGCDLGALRARTPALLRARDRAGIERWLAASC